MAIRTKVAVILAGLALWLTLILRQGLLNAVPAGLDWANLGCVENQRFTAEEYFFWEAYRGFVSNPEARGNFRQGRLAMDDRLCFSVPLPELNNTTARNYGYQDALESWMSLLDSGEWDTARGGQLKSQITALVGEHFDSYHEMKTWYAENREYLHWPGEGVALRIDLFARENHLPGLPARDRIHVTAVEYLLSNTHNLTHMPSMPPGIMEGEVYLDSHNVEARMFALQLRDPESQRHILMVRAAEDIDMLTGAKRARVLTRLGELTGGSFSTKQEWGQWWLRQREYVGHKEELYSLITGMQDPAEEQQFAITTGAYSLKKITDQSFDSPQQWLDWWSANHDRLRLSEDGKRLVP